MRDITVFGEDSFHENFVGALLRRLADEHSVGIAPRFLSARGGLPRMQAELKDFLRDLDRQHESPPDAVLVVVDANCVGYNERKRLMESVTTAYPALQPLVSYAIPAPHIERWMLVDPAAFKSVFGRGCTLPANKCAKDEYKKLLRKEIRETGIDAPLGGEEFAEDIVNAMDLGRVEVSEPSFGAFLQTLKGLFNQWQSAED